MGWIAAGCTVMAAGAMFAAAAQATTIQELKASLGSAREKVVAMLNSWDKPEEEKLQQDVKMATQQVDAALAALMTNGATPDGVKAKLQEFKTTWESFKQTRDTELMPAVLY
jgi:chromosome segregation ATPase